MHGVVETGSGDSRKVWSLLRDLLECSSTLSFYTRKTIMLERFFCREADKVEDNFMSHTRVVLDTTAQLGRVANAFCERW